MISFITGKIYNINKDSVTVLTTGGVGYEISIQVGKLVNIKVGEEIDLYTYLRVTENSMDLYGFENLEEKHFFELLISVSGIGPKGALNILALGELTEIQNAISRGDADYLSKVNGIGKKTAERIAVELKSKIGEGGRGKGESGVEGKILGDVIDGLVALGYSKEEARLVIKKLDAEGKTSEELLREALKGVGK